jgi:F-type H+-transporting ATPase subunit delta
MLPPPRAGVGLFRAYGIPLAVQGSNRACAPFAGRPKDADMARNKAHTGGVAERYATALFELAMEERAVDTVSHDFAGLKSLLDESPELARLVRAPVFSAGQQKLGMDAVLQRMEAAPLTTRFVLTLASKRRLFALTQIIEAYERLVARQRGEISAEVSAARPLSDAETADLKRVLKEKLGRDARLSTKVDPSLLGGLVVKVGSRMIDSSLRTKLEGLRAAMRGH